MKFHIESRSSIYDRIFRWELRGLRLTLTVDPLAKNWREFTACLKSPRADLYTARFKQRRQNYKNKSDNRLS